VLLAVAGVVPEGQSRRQVDRIAFPLSVGPTARYLVDAQRRPVFLQGDSPWSLIVGASEAEAKMYLSDREAKGVNALIVNLVEHKFNGPATRDGLVPFATPGDLGTPNEAYFAHADRVLRRAADHGMAVMLNPLYLGYKGSDEGWYQEALLNGAFKCRQYGRWVGRRYASFSNIVWVAGGDRVADAATDCIEGLVGGIREHGGQLWTAHPGPNVEAMAGYAYAGLDLNATYSYGIVHADLFATRRRHPIMPFVLFESSYEGEHNASRVQIRRQAWWALLSGATGQFYGARPVWLFDPGWKEALQLPGAVDLSRFATLVRELPWPTFVPDEDHEIVVGGLGELHGLDTLAAASTADGKTLVAYAPSRRTLTIDLSTLTGSQWAGYWWDPTTGRRVEIPPMNGPGKVTLDTPFPEDAALVLTAR
jgi:hypothetical protein